MGYSRGVPGALALVVLLARPASAQVSVGQASLSPETDTSGPTHHLLRFAVEESAILGIQLVWYYTHIDFSGEDIELGWSWPDWEKKLTSFPHFDTNGFYTNSIAHGLSGLFEYQVARANGFGVAGSTLVGFAGTALWEYVIEYRERPSLNDLFVNTAAGLTLAEPMLRISRALRHGHPTPARWLLAFGLSPFDLVNDGLDRDMLLAGPPAPCLRGMVRSGGQVVGLSDAPDRAELVFGLDLELADEPGYGRPGAISSWTHLGAWSALDLQLAVLPSGDDAGLVGARASTRASLFGHYRQDVADAPSGTFGSGRFLGADTGLDFETRLLGKDWDRLAIFHMIGPDLSIDWYLGATTVRWTLRAFGDLSMVDAVVFGPVSPFAPSMPPTSTLRSKGYYFAYGATLESRLCLELGGWTASIALRGHQFWSIDGLDRTEMSGPEDPHGVRDQRGYGRLELDVPFGRSGFGLSIFGDLIVRRGEWADRERVELERSIGTSLTVVP